MAFCCPMVDTTLTFEGVAITLTHCSPRISIAGKCASNYNSGNYTSRQFERNISPPAGALSTGRIGELMDAGTRVMIVGAPASVVRAFEEECAMYVGYTARTRHYPPMSPSSCPLAEAYPQPPEGRSRGQTTPIHRLPDGEIHVTPHSTTPHRSWQI